MKNRPSRRDKMSESKAQDFFPFDAIAGFRTLGWCQLALLGALPLLVVGASVPSPLAGAISSITIIIVAILWLTCDMMGARRWSRFLRHTDAGRELSCLYTRYREVGKIPISLTEQSDIRIQLENEAGPLNLAAHQQAGLIMDDYEMLQRVSGL